MRVLSRADLGPNLAVNAGAHRRSFTRPVGAGYLTRYAEIEYQACAGEKTGLIRHWGAPENDHAKNAAL
jgi:hypothetical protein